jgi:hypothetical protein
MKKYIILGLAVLTMIISGNELLAQRHPDNRRGPVVAKPKQKPPVKRATVVRVNKYPRNKVVVVKPRRARSITVLPAGHTVVAFKGKNFYYHSGYYYNHVGNGYTVIAPPVGVRIRVLPPVHTRIIVQSVPFIYSLGVFYREVENEYEVVDPPIGAVIPDLPLEDVEEVTIDGQKYLECNGVLYKTRSTENGLQYEVVGKVED